MSDPIVSTKLRAPVSRAGIVPRTPLMDRLEEPNWRIVLVTAPAGFGKTTVVADWLRVTGHGHVWCWLDELDNDLHRFFSHIAGGLELVDQGRPKMLRRVLSAPSASIGPVHFATALINDLEGASDDLVVVLHDYYVIEATGVHDALAYFLSHMPARVRVVICTREDPPLALSRLRAHGKLHDIRASDLAFREQEAAEFLNGAMGSRADGIASKRSDRSRRWVDCRSSDGSYLSAQT